MATPSWAGQGPWGWLVALHDLGWQVGAPGPLSPHHLVSWLESWASLTRLCTSISVLSLVPESSFSAPICSRTVERCSAVHFRTKGFRWLKKKKKIQSQLRDWLRPGIVDLQLCLHAPRHDGLQNLSWGHRGSSKKEQSCPDHRTQDDNVRIGEGRRSAYSLVVLGTHTKVLTTSGPPEPVFTFPNFSPPRKILPNPHLLLCPPQPPRQNVTWG